MAEPSALSDLLAAASLDEHGNQGEQTQEYEEFENEHFEEENLDDNLSVRSRTDISLRELLNPNNAPSELFDPSLYGSSMVSSYASSYVSSTFANQPPKPLPSFALASLRCPAKNCTETEAGEEGFPHSGALMTHLKARHGVDVHEPGAVSMVFGEYLDHYKEDIISWSNTFVPVEFDQETLEAAAAAVVSAATKGADSDILLEPEPVKVLTLGAADDLKDKELRTSLQQKKLEEVLKSQERERLPESFVPRRCLFCKLVADERPKLFRHMFYEHSFNIGLPSNVVQIDEFLSILQTKLECLQCLYCEKIFKSSTVLRKHMRKKKHFKISPRQALYDRFYAINYLEPGKNWETLQKEGNDSDDDRDEEDWDDWTEQADEPTNCILCPTVAQSPSACCAHMKSEHQFDIRGVLKAMKLEFYLVIKAINFMRTQTSKSHCMHCDENVPSLLDHYRENPSHLTLPSEDLLWNKSEYLMPFIEGDPLLFGLDVDQDDFLFDEDDEDFGPDVSAVRAALRRNGKLRQGELLEAVEADRRVSLVDSDSSDDETDGRSSSSSASNNWRLRSNGTSSSSYKSSSSQPQAIAKSAPATEGGWQFVQGRKSTNASNMFAHAAGTQIGTESMRPHAGNRPKNSWDRKGEHFRHRAPADQGAHQPQKDKDGFVVPLPQQRTQRKSTSAAPPSH